jgi:hypothetical protein
VPNSGVLRRQLTPLKPLVRRIETAEALDPVGQAVGQAVGKAVRENLSGGVKHALSGTWLGHALHRCSPMSSSGRS